MTYNVFSGMLNPTQSLSLVDQEKDEASGWSFLVGVNSLSFLQCFETVYLVIGVALLGYSEIVSNYRRRSVEEKQKVVVVEAATACWCFCLYVMECDGTSFAVDGLCFICLTWSPFHQKFFVE